jgi:translocation and assembly module TamB
MAYTTPPPDEPKTAPSPARGSRRTRRFATWVIGAPAALALLLALTLLGALQFERGSQALWRTGVWLMQGKLSGEYIGGSVARGLQMRNVRYRDSSTDLAIDRLDGRWRLAIGARKLSVDYLHIGSVRLHLQPTPSKPLVLPQNLQLPIAVELKDLRLQKLLVLEGTGSTEIGDLRLHGASDGTRHSLSIDSLRTPYGEASAQLALSGLRPFALSGGLELSGAFQQEHYRIAARLGGSLQALNIALTADGDKLSGAAQIDATPFAAVPLQRAQISMDHINPKTFSAGAPQADLALRADLQPVASTANDAPLAVAGTIAVTNAIPGALDRDRLPLQAISAEVALDARVQQLKRLSIRLPDGGLIDGSGAYRLNGAPQAGNGSFDLKVTGLNLQALHGAMRPTRLRGPLTVKLQGGTQHIALALSDAKLSAELDLLIDQEKLQIRQARLSEGPARLELSGVLAQTGDMAYSASGKLSRFDPAALSGKTSAARHASINMDFDIAGTIAAQPRLKLRFGLRDSVYDRLPMSGKGSIDMLGQRLLAGDVSLLVAGNRLLAKGSFGGPSDRLNLNIDAPQLQRLGYGLSGLLKADGQLGGSLQRPTVRASYQAQKLAFGQHSLDSLSGNADLQGDLGGIRGGGADRRDNRLNLHIAARGYRSPELTLNTLDANLAGSFAGHTLQLGAKGALRGQALALNLGAHGKLINNQGKYAWNGSIDTLDNTGAPRFALQSPLSVDAAEDRLILGSSRLSIAGALVDLQHFSYRQGAISSQGSVQALDVGAVMNLLRQFNVPLPPLQTDLVLDSRWSLALAESASGFFEIERKSGDAIVNAGDVDVPLGLQTLKLRADLQNNAVNMNAALHASRIGSINGKGALTLIREDKLLTLTPASALSAHVVIDVPKLETVGALLGPKVAFKGSLSAQLDAAGTLAHPKLSGAVNGDRLAVTLFDQGIQLQDGTVRVTMNENVIDLRRFEFYGGKGTLRANGLVQLGQANPDLNATLVADKLELFASPDRQLMLSGQAKIASLAEQLRIDGKFTVDHALFDLPKSSAPKLGSDVVVVRDDGKAKAGAQQTPQEKMAVASEKPAGRFSPTIDIMLDLGNDFRFRGGGADLRLRGAMNVKSEPYAPLRGFGTIHVADGVYETFGVKLAIERGIINFQGPIDNPNINLLAMRRNQDIPAGVEVTGYANAPRIRLVSEPNVSEEEKLSWIMFGQGSSSGLGQRNPSGEALAFLGNLGGKKIAQGIGLDQFSIGSSESGIIGVAGDQFVNLGKAISQKFMLGYEQSLTGAQSVAKLTYQLSRSWSVLMRGGTINSLNLLFSRRYD